MADELPWHQRIPDFTQPLWLRLEKKLGRHLTPKENEYIFYRSSMFKEWLFKAVDDAATAQEAEQILAGGKNFVVYQPPSLLTLLFEGIKQWLK